MRVRTQEVGLCVQVSSIAQPKSKPAFAAANNLTLRSAAVYSARLACGRRDRS